MTDARHTPEAAAFPLRLRLALAVPLASAVLVTGVALALRDPLDEAAFAGVATAFGSVLGLLNALSLARPGRRGVPWLPAALLPALLMASCYAYARLMGHPPVDTRAGLAVILAALGLAAVASSALGLARTRRALERRPQRASRVGPGRS